MYLLYWGELIYGEATALRRIRSLSCSISLRWEFGLRLSIDDSDLRLLELPISLTIVGSLKAVSSLSCSSRVRVECC